MSFLRLEEVCKEVGLGVSYIYKLVRQGDFPQPVKIGSKATRWVQSEVIDWMEARKAARPPLTSPAFRASR